MAKWEARDSEPGLGGPGMARESEPGLQGPGLGGSGLGSLGIRAGPGRPGNPSRAWEAWDSEPGLGVPEL